jgi:hypothetical protein
MSPITILLIAAAAWFFFLRPRGDGGGGDGGGIGDVFGGGGNAAPPSQPIPQGISEGGGGAPVNVPTPTGVAIPNWTWKGLFTPKPLSPPPFYRAPQTPPAASPLSVPTLPPPVSTHSMQAFATNISQVTNSSWAPRTPLPVAAGPVTSANDFKRATSPARR